jgi:hypothetical protein
MEIVREADLVDEMSVEFKFPGENIKLTVTASQDEPLAFMWVNGRTVSYFEKLLSFETHDLDAFIAALIEARSMIRDRKSQV